MRCIAILRGPWVEPAAALAPFAEEPFAVLLATGGGGRGRWSYLARDPDRTVVIGPADPAGDFAAIAALLGPPAPTLAEGPAFQGGVIALVAYEFADRLEPLGLARDGDWPDLIAARYPALIAFDHDGRETLAIGRGDTPDQAAARACAALAWLDGGRPAPGLPLGPPAAAFEPLTAPGDYEAAVADVVEAIAAGEIFQANVARFWHGRLVPSAAPLAVFERLLAASPAPYCAYARFADLALVSHSPEQFLAVGADGVGVSTRPIKGTRPRRCQPAADAAEAAALLASAKDRAENLMIVDLMRNDLARVCEAGSIAVPALFALESYPSVHHLVSTVSGRLAAGAGPAELLAATFPPGSITGAPKVQAMRVIARHEPPRGPWCGTLAWIGFDGAMNASVLIRTAAFARDADGWRFRAAAGAGVVADSDPAAERAETEAKIAGLRRALFGP